GAFHITGTIANGGTLTANATTGDIHLGSGGVISGGTVTSAGGASFIVDAGTLSGVTLDTDLTVPNNVSMGIQGGLTFANGHKMTLAAGVNNTVVSLTGNVSQTIGGTGEIVFGGTSGNNFLDSTSSSGSPTHTIGSGVLVHGGTGNIRLFQPLVNNGTISADVSGKTIAISSTGPLTNNGTLRAINGGTLTVQPTSWTNTGILSVGTLSRFNLDGSLPGASVEGHLQNTGGGAFHITGTIANGGTLTANATTGDIHLGSGGVISGGTVTSAGGASFIVDAGTLSGVTLDTDLTVPNNVSMGIQGGLTFANGHKITLAAGVNNTVVNLTGNVSQTIGGTGEIVFGGTSGNNFLDSTSSSGSPTHTIGSGVLVHGGTGNIRLFQPLVNNGTISADVSGKTIAISS